VIAVPAVNNFKHSDPACIYPCLHLPEGGGADLFSTTSEPIGEGKHYQEMGLLVLHNRSFLPGSPQQRTMVWLGVLLLCTALLDSITDTG
jgi:hypothetical protein